MSNPGISCELRTLYLDNDSNALFGMLLRTCSMLLWQQQQRKIIFMVEVFVIQFVVKKFGLSKKFMHVMDFR